MIPPHRIEQELKIQLQGVYKKLKKIKRLDSISLFGSALVTGLAFFVIPAQISLLAAMAVAGIMVNALVSRLFPQHHHRATDEHLFKSVFRDSDKHY